MMAYYWTAAEHHTSYPHQPYQDDRYAIECGTCASLTWFDTDEELPERFYFVRMCFGTGQRYPCQRPDWC